MKYYSGEVNWQKFEGPVIRVFKVTLHSVQLCHQRAQSIMVYNQNMKFKILERKAFIRTATTLCTTQSSSWQSLQISQQLNEHEV